MVSEGETRGGELPPPSRKRAELLAFATLAILIWPILTVGVVGAYGFIVWMTQLVLGPPGPPG